MSEQLAARRQVKRLFWLYFWLLIFEGALRKWIVPTLSTPLLLVRDPVVIAIYYFTMRAKIFPNNGFIKLLFWIAAPSFFAGLLATILSNRGSILVPIFGFQANFLHIPLIFILPSVMDKSDLKRLGLWILILSLPMAGLLVAQFRASKGDWLNAGAGVESGQIDSADGKIRPAGTFSFVTGTVSYLSLVTVFVVYGVIERGVYSFLLLVPAGLTLATSLAVSGSRSAIYSAGIVMAMVLAGVLLNGKLFLKACKLLFFVAIVGLAITCFDFYKEGIEATTRRIDLANTGESLIDRFLGGFAQPFYLIADTPILGYGLGVGTNAGATLITGKVSFLLAEGEWARNLLESGPVLGLAFILLRCGLAGMLGRFAILRVRNGNCLPLLLFGVCVLPIINGQFGQATTAGFAVFTAGLCLAASDRETSTTMVPA